MKSCEECGVLMAPADDVKFTGHQWQCRSSYCGSNHRQIPLSAYTQDRWRNLAEVRYYNGSIPDYLLDPEDRRRTD